MLRDQLGCNPMENDGNHIINESDGGWMRSGRD